MKISIIAAMDKNQVIGYKGDLPWYIPEDLAHFKNTVKGHILICGRKTYETLPKKYHTKTTIVITSKNSHYFQCTTASNVFDAFRKARALLDSQKGLLGVFVIGGGSVYHETIGMADELILSYVNGEFKGDTFFPYIYYEKWRAVKFKKEKDFKIITWRKR